jgi:hypothetical protein
MTSATKAKTQDVNVYAESLLSAGNFAELANLAGADLVSAGVVLGDGYAIVNKAELVGKAMILNSYSFYESVQDGEVTEFVSATAILQTPIAISGDLVNKVRFNDGGTGVYSQLKSMFEKDGFKPILAKKGLSASHYTHEKHGQSTTYYIDTSAV